MHVYYALFDYELLSLSGNPKFRNNCIYNFCKLCCCYYVIDIEVCLCPYFQSSISEYNNFDLFGYTQVTRISQINDFANMLALQQVSLLLRILRLDTDKFILVIFYTSLSIK